MTAIIPLLSISLAFCAVSAPKASELEGRWAIVSIESAGQKATWKGMTFEFKGHELIWRDSAPQHPDEKITFKVHSEAKPRQIDVTFVRAPGTIVDGRTLLGIYKVEDDTLKICWTHEEGKRPTSFTGRGEPTVFTLKRSKR